MKYLLIKPIKSFDCKVYLKAVRVVPQVEEDSECHVNDGDDDGQFHFVRVQVDDLVLSQHPNGIDAEPVRISAIMAAAFQVISGRSVVVITRFVEVGDQHAVLHAFFEISFFIVVTVNGFVRVVDAPRRTEDVHGFRKDVVVDQARVHGEETHQQDDVTSSEEYAPHLKQMTTLT